MTFISVNKVMLHIVFLVVLVNRPLVVPRGPPKVSPFLQEEVKKPPLWCSLNLYKCRFFRNECLGETLTYVRNQTHKLRILGQVQCQTCFKLSPFCSITLCRKMISYWLCKTELLLIFHLSMALLILCRENVHQQLHWLISLLLIVFPIQRMMRQRVFRKRHLEAFTTFPGHNMGQSK